MTDPGERMNLSLSPRDLHRDSWRQGAQTLSQDIKEGRSWAHLFMKPLLRAGQAQGLQCPTFQGLGRPASMPGGRRLVENTASVLVLPLFNQRLHCISPSLLSGGSCWTPSSGTSYCAKSRYLEGSSEKPACSHGLLGGPACSR